MKNLAFRPVRLRRLGELANFFSKHRVLSLITAIFMVVAIDQIDFRTIDGMGLSILYLVPIFLVTWTFGRNMGVLTACVSAVLWGKTEIRSHLYHKDPFLLYWNLSVRLGFFLIFVILIYLVSELRNAIQREREAARSDFLTGIANRKHFIETAEVEIKRCARDKKPLTVVYIDCDNFKVLNDSQGHDAGDKCLVLISNTLKENIRATDMAARLGGDEFALLLPGMGSQEAEDLVARVRRFLNQWMKMSRWPVTFSIGVGTFSHPKGPVDEIMKKVDHVMYSVKRTTKNAMKQKAFKS